MFIVLPGFMLIGLLSAGLIYGILSVILKYEKPTETLLYWILTSVLSVTLAGIFIYYITSVTDITFVKK